jgi:hypothetical protein
MRVAKQVMQDPERITTEPTVVIPPLAEAEVQVPDCRPLDRELGVVPRRPIAIHRRHGLMLSVTVMVGVVAPAVAQVDAADKSNVVFRSARVPNDDELLVVGAAKPHALVEQDLSSGGVHHLSEVAILLGAETQPVEVRPPDQASHYHPVASGGG